MLKTIKIPTVAPTCFGSCRNHHRGAISCLAVVQVCGTACLHNRLVCHLDIDHVINNEHNRIIIVVLAKH